MANYSTVLGKNNVFLNSSNLMLKSYISLN